MLHKDCTIHTHPTVRGFPCQPSGFFLNTLHQAQIEGDALTCHMSNSCSQEAALIMLCILQAWTDRTASSGKGSSYRESPLQQKPSQSGASVMLCILRACIPPMQGVRADMLSTACHGR